MSTHCFETIHDGKRVIVQLGYDRPLGHLFMVVQAASGQDEPIYSNLFQADPFVMTVTDYQHALKQLGIVVPQAMFEAVEFDRLTNAGNRVVWYEQEGQHEVH